MIEIPSTGVPVKAWVEGVVFEESAREQVAKMASLPVVGPHIAIMPDVHAGKGAVVGSVVPTIGAIVPSMVGVDIGCGVVATKLDLKASDLPDSLSALRLAIEQKVPHGRTNNGGPGDQGAWGGVRGIPNLVDSEWDWLLTGYCEIIGKNPGASPRAPNAGWSQLGTLGGGNHFIEVCLDTEQNVWVMLHSGSRGVGNRIGSYFIELAHKDMEAAHGYMPTDKDLCYLTEGTEHFDDYVQAVSWAQQYAMTNRDVMLERTLDAIDEVLGRGVPRILSSVVNCHHNYVSKEQHFGKDVWLTRKGAVDASKGKMGIIPGSMGDRSYIVRGKGNPESFNSCSHGAGRVMSRNVAKKTYDLAAHKMAMSGIESRLDDDIIDETPMAYKRIEDVMHAQRDLVEVVATLKQVLCVKG